MTAGQRRHRIRIERSTETVNAAGQPVLTWATLYRSVPAAVMSVSQNEADTAERKRQDSIVTFETQYIEGVTPADRVVWYTVKDERTFGVSSVIDPEAKRRRLVWTCEEST